MNIGFINCFTAEWLKKRRSFASWLVLAGGFFIPLVNMIIFMVYPKQLLSLHTSGQFWKLLFQHSWQIMAIMLLPMGIVLAVSLITQLEFKNNTWKQLHTTPVSFGTVYFAKLLVLLVMLVQLFILFNIGNYLSVIIPVLFNRHFPFPNYPADFAWLLKENAAYFLMCMPMVALQYIISLQYKNFMIPIGAGLVVVVGGLIAISWKYAFTIPSAYTGLYFLQSSKSAPPAHNLFLWSACYFLLFSLLGYWLYISKKEKG